jgi:cell wall-associated NlpC family hydrolase
MAGQTPISRPFFYCLKPTKISLFIEMRYGIINRNITDLRSKPDFRSERKSQLLFGQSLEIGRIQKGYLKVKQPDGYAGWVDTRGIIPMSKSNCDTFKRKTNSIVTSPTANLIKMNKNIESNISFLFYGTRLNLLKKDGYYGIIATPDGSRYKVALANIAPTIKTIPKDFDPRLIIREAKKFLGTPYLWGGVSPFGFDCSGLVQTIYGRFGIQLPRDSKDQRKAGKKVSSDKIRRGDLLFYPGHIAIAIDKNRIIHASLAEGGVAINSLKSEDKDFRPDLVDSFIEARRVLP